MKELWYIVNVEAAIYKDDKWLVIKRGFEEEHAPGALSLVGGKVENEGIENDILESTLKREVLEEVGIEIEDDMHYLESKTFVTDNEKSVVDLVFVCRYKRGEAKVVNKSEVEGVNWMTIDAILSHKNAPHYLKKSLLKAEKMRLRKRQ